MNIQKIIESLLAITELSQPADNDDYLRGYRDALKSVSRVVSESVSSSSSVSGRLSSENPRFPARSDEYSIASVSRGVLKDELIEVEDEILTHLDCPFTDGWNSGGFRPNSLVARTRHITELQELEQAGDTEDFNVHEWNLLARTTAADGGIGKEEENTMNSENEIIKLAFDNLNVFDSKYDYLAEERGDWQYFITLIEEEYGYRHWIWRFHGTAEDCIEFFKNRTPENCQSSVEKLDAPAQSHVWEVTYEEWAKSAEDGLHAGEVVNGYAHWHEPYDTKLTVEDKQGNRFDFHSVEDKNEEA